MDQLDGNIYHVENYQTTTRRRLRRGFRGRALAQQRAHAAAQAHQNAWRSGARACCGVLEHALERAASLAAADTEKSATRRRCPRLHVARCSCWLRFACERRFSGSARECTAENRAVMSGQAENAIAHCQSVGPCGPIRIWPMLSRRVPKRTCHKLADNWTRSGWTGEGARDPATNRAGPGRRSSRLEQQRCPGTSCFRRARA